MAALLDRMQTLLGTPGLTDLVLNGFHTAHMRVGNDWVLCSAPFESADELRDLLIDEFELAGIGLNYKNPLASMVVDGFRIHGVLGFGVSPTIQVSIRKLGLTGPEVPAPFAIGTLSHRWFEALAQAMTQGASVLVAGGAGSGKTTILRALLSRMTGFRVVTLEDAPELGLAGQNVVSLLTRPPNQDGAGEITLDRLLREALRMSPDRIAVGEVRGDELGVMLEALNTGHSGAGATIHANSLLDLASRLEALGMRAGIDPQTLARQVVSAFSLAVLATRSDGFSIAQVAKPVLGGKGLEFRLVD